MTFVPKSYPIDLMSFMSPIIIGAVIALLINWAYKKNRIDIALKLMGYTGWLIIIGTILILLVPLAIIAFIIYVKFFAQV